MSRTEKDLQKEGGKSLHGVAAENGPGLCRKGFPRSVFFPHHRDVTSRKEAFTGLSLKGETWL